MKSILFSCFDNMATTGARYAERVMRDALLSRYRTTVFNATSVPAAPPALLALLAKATNGLFDLTITSDNYIPADMVYVQPHAGGDVKLPWADTMTFKGEMPLSIRMLYPLARQTYKTAQLMGNSQYTCELVDKEFGCKSWLLYPPVPVHLYQEQEYTRFNEVITLSSLNPRKNLHFIPEVAKLLPEYDFGLIGYAVQEHFGIMVNILKQFSGLKSRFKYYSSLSDHEKAEILQRRKVYFHPTLYEPFGIATVEAMAAGCIPVVHDSGGAKEFVPPEWRFTTTEEAAELIKKASSEWTPKVANNMREIAYRYREEAFKEIFLGQVEDWLSTPKNHR